MEKMKLDKYEKEQLFVEYEILCNVGSLVDELSKGSGGFEEAWLSEYDELQARQCAEAEAEAEAAGEEFDVDDVPQPEVYEYWAVTHRGMDWLRQVGEQVMEYGTTNICLDVPQAKPFI